MVQINTLAVYPLQFYPDLDRTRNDLIQYSRTFLSLQGIHYKEYNSQAFWFNNKGKQHIYYIKSRIIINAIRFHKCNPKYSRQQVNKKKLDALDFTLLQLPYADRSSQVKYIDIDLEQLGDNKLILFNLIVLGFSLKDKRFCLLSQTY